MVPRHRLLSSFPVSALEHFIYYWRHSKKVFFSLVRYNPHKFIRGENARRGCFVERNDNKNNNNNNNTAAVVAVVAATSSFSFWRVRRGESFWNEIIIIIIIIIINFCGTRTAREEALFDDGEFARIGLRRRRRRR